MPYMRSVQSVFKPSDFNDGNPALRGVGGLGDVNASNGVFGTAQGGGGVFGPSLYGLGSVTTSTTVTDKTPGSCPMPDACAQVQGSAAAKAHMDMSLLDPFGNYGKYCADPAYQAHITTKCQAAIAAVLAGGSGGGVPPTAAPPAPPPAPLTPDAVRSIQTMLNGALAKAGYQTLTVDGQVGPGTCGAIAWYRAQGNPTAGQAFDVICTTKGSRAPTKRSAGGGGGGGGMYQAPPSTVPGGAQPPAEPATASMMSSGTWAMVGGGLLAIGLAVVGKKKGWF
jgi:hypothetical protein